MFEIDAVVNAKLARCGIAPLNPALNGWRADGRAVLSGDLLNGRDGRTYVYRGAISRDTPAAFGTIIVEVLLNASSGGTNGLYNRFHSIAFGLTVR